MANNTYITGDINGIPAARRKSAGPLVQAVEPAKGDWNQNNNWGFILDKSGGWPLVNNPTIISVAQNPTFRGPPRGRGVVLTRVDNFVGGTFTPEINIQARVTLGIGGVSRQFMVDWGANTTLNLPSSNTVIEAVVTGNNDNSFGAPILGSILQVLFSNEILPKDGYNTLTEKVAVNNNSIHFLKPFVRGFMFLNRNMLDIDMLQFFAPGISLAAQKYTVEELVAAGSDAIHWLPTGCTMFDSTATPGNDECVINWVLSV